MMQLKARRSAAASSLQFALVFALLISNSLAGRQRSFMIDQGSAQLQQGPEAEKKNGARIQVHGRILSVKTNDYGSYDPSPSMDKPHFKLIPN
ncbi:protein CASPARIAN STRIP INTEGRITY FACTOR 1-like [Oryza brachyantha]|uniref:Dirigent protein n=1 Tax=Oryza brachyantha TaxID=4533 RepID=J3LCG3_ORYBR|nr:protein CASPARIAN STRIP INTEGRITY FACTOR 1-like [Oryza brachyantha]